MERQNPSEMVTDEEAVYETYIIDTQGKIKIYWIHYRKHIETPFLNAYDDPDYADCALVCDHKILKAHKFVLASGSVFFDKIFKSARQKQTNFFFSDVRFEVLCDFVKFIYTGKLQIPREHFQEYIEYAERISVTGIPVHPEHEVPLLENMPRRPPLALPGPSGSNSSRPSACSVTEIIEISDDEDE